MNVFWFLLAIGVAVYVGWQLCSHNDRIDADLAGIRRGDAINDEAENGWER